MEEATSEQSPTHTATYINSVLPDKEDVEKGSQSIVQFSSPQISVEVSLSLSVLIFLLSMCR